MVSWKRNAHKKKHLKQASQFVTCSQTVYFLFTEVIKNSYICLRKVNWIHWRASSITHISTREIRCEQLVIFLRSLQLSLFLTQVTIYRTYFSSHHSECLFYCFSLHVDTNSLDVTEESVNGLAVYETFCWSVGRAVNWFLGYNGFQCLPWPSLITALSATHKAVPF